MQIDLLALLAVSHWSFVGVDGIAVLLVETPELLRIFDLVCDLRVICSIQHIFNSAGLGARVIKHLNSSPTDVPFISTLARSVASWDVVSASTSAPTLGAWGSSLSSHGSLHAALLVVCLIVCWSTVITVIFQLGLIRIIESLFKLLKRLLSVSSLPIELLRCLNRMLMLILMRLFLGITLVL